MTILIRLQESKSQSSLPKSFEIIPSSWDDYSFKTSFQLVYVNAQHSRLNLGTVKIGYAGQSHGWTKDALKNGEMVEIPPTCFSVGQDVDYYKSIREKLPLEIGNELLKVLGDVVFDNVKFIQASQEKVFQDSLLRSVSLSVIEGQFKRVLNNLPALTTFKFLYHDPGSAERAEWKINFEVFPNSKPSTNIHVLIGRNGIGKTSMLNNMVHAGLSNDIGLKTSAVFNQKISSLGYVPLSENYFSSVISVSFSAFDPFLPPINQPDRMAGVAYFYIGMKINVTGGPSGALKDRDHLCDDFVNGMESCFSQPAKKLRWLNAIKYLESDLNFKHMDLSLLAAMDDERARSGGIEMFNSLSSGHAIVLLTLTQLVDTVEEKALVLIDEPETHLHPPLLSAFMTALGDLLRDRNAVAIIATHSPVIAQEVPRDCVWKLQRLGREARTDRPDRETFGENVGLLTREIFGLEVSKSGYHATLEKAVSAGGTFESILSDFEGQLGYEAQIILRTLIRSRDKVGAAEQ